MWPVPRGWRMQFLREQMGSRYHCIHSYYPFWSVHLKSTLWLFARPLLCRIWLTCPTLSRLESVTTQESCMCHPTCRRFHLYALSRLQQYQRTQCSGRVLYFNQGLCLSHTREFRRVHMVSLQRHSRTECGDAVQQTVHKFTDASAMSDMDTARLINGVRWEGDTSVPSLLSLAFV